MLCELRYSLDGMMRARVEHSVRATTHPSPRVLEVASMFGIDLDDGGETVHPDVAHSPSSPRGGTVRIIERCEIPLPAGGIVFITGPSGSGKSTLLRLIAQAIEAPPASDAMNASLRPRPIVRAADLDSPWPDRALVDLFDGLSLQRTLSLLSRVGLAEAAVMLRSPGQMSDGQRARLALARLLAECERVIDQPDRSARIVLTADEFAATLDRLTASSLARSLRAWITRTPHTFIVATTHDDLLEPLEPDVLVYKHIGPRVEVCVRK